MPSPTRLASQRATKFLATGLLAATLIRRWIHWMGEQSAYGRAMEYERKRKRADLKKKQGERFKMGRCNAQKKDGGRCQQAKGWGTTHPGVGPCKMHGGRTNNHKLNAAKQQAILMGAPLDINPVDALYWCIKITAGEVKFLTEQIATIEK